MNKPIKLAIAIFVYISIILSILLINKNINHIKTNEEELRRKIHEHARKMRNLGIK